MYLQSKPKAKDEVRWWWIYLGYMRICFCCTQFGYLLHLEGILLHWAWFIRRVVLGFVCVVSRKIKASNGDNLQVICCPQNVTTLSLYWYRALARQERYWLFTKSKIIPL